MAKIPFYLIAPNSAFHFADDQDGLVDLICTQAMTDNAAEQTFSDAFQSDWEDTDLRLEVFGPHFTEDTLKDTLDLVDAVECMNKGYIL